MLKLSMCYIGAETAIMAGKAKQKVAPDTKEDTKPVAKPAEILAGEKGDK